MHKIERSEDEFVVLATSQQLSNSLVDTRRPGSHDPDRFGESGQQHRPTGPVTALRYDKAVEILEPSGSGRETGASMEMGPSLSEGRSRVRVTGRAT